MTRWMWSGAALLGTGAASWVGLLPWAQWAVCVVAAAWIGFRLFFVLDMIFRFAISNVLTSALIVGFYAMLIGMLGAEYGIMNLFWHEEILTRLAASFFTTFFFGLMFSIAFYSDPNRAATRRRLVAYLSDHRSLGQILRDNAEGFIDGLRAVRDWFRGHGWARSTPPRRPVVEVSDQVFAVQDDIKRFFKVFFHPFWLLLLLPALAPTVFPWVPRNLPIKLAGADLALIRPENNDVARVWLAWLAGIALWGAGLMAGRLMLIAFVELNRRLFGLLPPESRTDPTLAMDVDPIINWICPLPPEAWSGEGGAELSPKQDVQRAVIRFTAGLFGIYALAVLIDLILTSDRWLGLGALGEDAIRRASFAGAIILAVSTVGMAFFLKKHGWALRREYADRSRGRFLQRCHLALTLTMALGVVLAGMNSAVFLVFLFLAIVATVNLIVNRLSRSWNWPIEAIPLSALLIVGIVGLIWMTNHRPEKLPLPGLEAYYHVAERPSIQASLERGERANPMDDKEVLEAWKKSTGKKKPKLAILAVSGGANRAAFWTAKVIEELDAVPGFREQLRVITGASGGMVGASHYVAALYRKQAGLGTADEQAPTLSGDEKSRAASSWLIRDMPTDVLTPVVRQWMLGDVPLSFWPFDLNRAMDRGLTLERAWPRLDLPFQSLASVENQGRIPSLIFSPMLVEDGRQLLVSNLNLPFMTNSKGGMLDPDVPIADEAKYETQLYSYPSVELFDVIPGVEKDVKLATVVRLNASFPYVSPALSLPTRPFRRVVDAGYYDNYGIATASSWIFRHRAWLRDETSGVVLVQVRAYPKQVDRKTVTEPEETFFSGLGRAFEFLTSPVEGGTNSREASTLFRNDQVIEALSKWFREQASLPERDRFFTTVIFENVMDVSMTWYTTEQERALAEVGFGGESQEGRLLLESINPSPQQFDRFVQGMVNNRESLEKFRRWWNRGE